MGVALDLLEVHSRLLDQSQKKNGSALSQSGRMRPPNYRRQRTAVYDGPHKKRDISLNDKTFSAFNYNHILVLAVESVNITS